jgi:hypothetical protein
MIQRGIKDIVLDLNTKVREITSAFPPIEHFMLSAQLRSGAAGLVVHTHESLSLGPDNSYNLKNVCCAAKEISILIGQAWLRNYISNSQRIDLSQQVSKIKTQVIELTGKLKTNN